jgi:hypothetical protein
VVVSLERVIDSAEAARRAEAVRAANAAAPASPPSALPDPSPAVTD